MAINPLGAQFQTQVTSRLDDLSRRIANDVSRILDPGSPAPTDGVEVSQQTRLTARLRGLNALGQGIQLGVGLAQTADGILGSVNEDLQTIRDLTVRAANGTLNSSDRTAIQNQIEQISAGIDSTLATSTFNGQPIFGETRTIQVGEQGSVPIEFPELSVRVLANGPISTETIAEAQYSIGQVDQAIDGVSDVRASLGSAQNQLTRAQAEISSAAQNIASATVHQGDLLGAITNLKLAEMQFKAALKVTAAQLQTSEHVLELLR